MEITVFCCHNNLYGGAEAGTVRKAGVAGVHKVELPCGTRLEPIHILKAFENGADGVAVMACPDNSCHTIQGGARIAQRIEYAKKLIGEAGLNPERVMLYRPEPPSAKQFAGIVAEVTAKIFGLGPSEIKTGGNLRPAAAEYTDESVKRHAV